jgi:hypothetical protein
MDIGKVNHGQSHSSHPTLKANPQLLTLSKKVDEFAKDLEGDAFKAPISGQFRMRNSVELLNHPTKVTRSANKAAKHALSHNKGFPQPRR